MNNSLSIDIGGTKTRIIVYASTFQIIKELVLPTDDYLQKKGQSDLENLFNKIKQEVANLKFHTLGISFNCAIQNNTIVYSSLLGGGEGIHLDTLAKKYFNYQRFSSDNDVFCMAKAENKFGIGKKFPTYLYINLGTGIRAVFVENNQIIRGFKNLAGEVSQTKIWVDELGSYEIADELVTGKGLSRLALKMLDQKLTAKEIFEQRKEQVIKIFSKYLVNFLVQLSYVYNPEVIIFAGSIVNSAEQWLPEVREGYLATGPGLLLAKDLIISEVENPASIGAVI